jgi:acyl-coenzyme A thioesterase PaaI-like protein
MPADTNPNGDVFGGWIMSQMDIAAGMLAKQIAGSRVATVSVDTIRFLRPVGIGDTVTCYGDLVKVGRTSMARSSDRVAPRRLVYAPRWDDGELDMARPRISEHRSAA